MVVCIDRQNLAMRLVGGSSDDYIVVDDLHVRKLLVSGGSSKDRVRLGNVKVRRKSTVDGGRPRGDEFFLDGPTEGRLDITRFENMWLEVPIDPP